MLASRAHSAEAIDLRDGVRTLLYGGRFNGYPPTGDFYGWAMAFGDIDGDGFADFLSSSANSEGPNDLFGHEHDVYLIFGGPRAELDSVYAVDTPGGADIVFYRGGFAMACADINRDGYDDVILANDEIYVVFGAPRDQLRKVYDFNAEYPDLTPNPDYTPPDIRIIGSIWLGGAVINLQNSDFDFVALSLVSGDINGDGFADIVFGNHTTCTPPHTCQDGAAYIVFGRPRDQIPDTFDIDYSSSLPHPDVVILGDSNEHYPTNLAIGDLDGDGVGDLLVSTTWGWGENNTTPFLGEINGWWGKPDWKATYDTQIDEFDFSLQGTAGLPAGGVGYTLGYRIAIGDLDGDGRGDLILGSSSGYGDMLPTDRVGMGEYRVLFGRPRALWPRWGKAVDMTDVLILGAESTDALDLNGPQAWGICFSLATGNRDGDRFDDLLLGAGQLRRPDDQTRPGGAYLLRGRPRSQWEPFIDLRDGYDLVIHGVDYTGSPGYQYDRLGYVTGMGDLDGNGKDELFIGAPFADGPHNSIPDCGEIYVIYDDDAGSPTSEFTRPPLAPSALLPNFPNPFSASTTFRVRASAGEDVSLTVYDALGREVARPLESTMMTGNEREILWRATDHQGRALPSGVYFVKLRAGNESHARKVMLVR